jgi:small redox-active disulfide protein 2
MHIKILGSGCANCVALEKNTRQALADLGQESELTKVTDFGEIAGYGVMHTPALVVDEAVLVSGRVPKADEIKSLLARHGSSAPTG